MERPENLTKIYETIKSITDQIDFRENIRQAATIEAKKIGEFKEWRDFYNDYLDWLNTK